MYRRQLCLQRRRGRLNSVIESERERERERRRVRPGYSKDVIDSTLSQQKRDRPGYSKDVIDSMLSNQEREREREQATANECTSA